MKTQNLQKNLLSSKTFLCVQAEKKAAKETQISSTKPGLHYLVAICYIFADQKNPHKAQALTSSSSQATIEKTKLQSYIMGSYSDEL
jgi:hypothetical protein